MMSALANIFIVQLIAKKDAWLVVLPRGGSISNGLLDTR